MKHLRRLSIAHLCFENNGTESKNPFCNYQKVPYIDVPYQL